MRFPILILSFWATTAVADGFERPIPQAQSATAELWFGLASLALIAALVLVHRLVMRR